VIAVDTNILVYAHRADSSWHGPAVSRLRELAEGTAAWAIPWPCLHEFVAIVTHPRIYQPPTPVEHAIAQVDAWLESPTLVVLGEAESHWEVLRELLRTGRVSGPLAHDARIAALCATHGIRTLWTADRDFGRFPGVNAVNPLVVG
jgi:toxin-antitoxin system PIN domain toxin